MTGKPIIENPFIEENQIITNDEFIFVHPDNVYRFYFGLFSFDDALDSCINTAKIRVRTETSRRINK